MRNLGTNVTGTTVAPISPSASYNATGQIRVIPQGTFDTTGNVSVPSNSAIAVNNGDSRWRLQFGARLRF